MDEKYPQVNTKKKVNVCMFLSVASEKEFVSRRVRGQFIFATDEEKVGEGAGLGQRAKGRAQHFSHRQRGGQWDKMREQ